MKPLLFHLNQKTVLLTGIIILALLLAACSTQPPALQETAQSTVASAEAVSNADELHTDSGQEAQTAEDKAEPELSASFAAIERLDTKLVIETDAVCYGNLRITLPNGVTAQQQEMAGSAAVIDLIGAEKIGEGEGYGNSGPFPPRIWLTNYHAEYGNIMELFSALLDLLPDTVLSERYAWGKERCYLLSYEKPDINGYILIYGNDVYLVEELSEESDYSFGGLLDDKAVRGGNGICDFGARYRNADKLYSKINVQDDMSFLVSQDIIRDRMRVILLFEDGYFTSLYQNIAYGEWNDAPAFEDCNFDGCPDMAISETKIYLWNADKKVYEVAQIPEEFSVHSWNAEYYPQAQSIWTYNVEYAKDAEGKSSADAFDQTEKIWKWEGTALVKKRECAANVREDSVRICAYEDSAEHVLFDETFTIEEWKQNSLSVQKRYQQFYAGMLPEENDGNLHKIDENQRENEAIPQALLDVITKSILDGTELETLKGLMNDKELTKEEVLALAKDNIALRSDVIRADRLGHYIMVMADGDNDGILDLVAEEYFGGSAGFTEYVFYKGQEDGTYQKTNSYDAVKEEFGMISYEGKNYLCRTRYDYSKKIYNGISLACYVDGVQVESADLMLFPEQYDTKLAECAKEDYRALAQDILQNSLFFKKQIDAHEAIVGSCEELSPLEEDHQYQCDLDNDKVMEHYCKSIWEPSNMGTHESLILYGDGEGIEHVQNAIKALRGQPIMMWVEPFAEENVVNVISLTGLHDFEVTGLLLHGADFKTMYRITAEVTYGVKCEIGTQMNE